MNSTPVPDAALADIRALRAGGRREEALARLQALLAQAPDHLPALELLAALLEEGPAPAQAVAARQRLVQLQPQAHERHADLAGLFFRLRRLPDAERSARQALALNPLNPQAHNLMGMIYAEVHRPEESEFHFRQVLLLHEPVAPVCANLANALKSMGRLDEAEAFFRQTLYLDPDNIEGLLSWVRMEEARRNVGRARELLERAETLRPGYPGNFVARSAVLRRDKRHDEALAALDALAATLGEDRLAAAYFFERGEVLDKLGRHPEAFAAFQRANALARASGRCEYGEGHFRDLAQRLRAFFTRPRIEAIKASVASENLPTDMPRPIFIVGFPRSGTTLTEQMLAGHPNISAGDELDYVFRLAQLAPHLSGSRLPYPECLANLARPEQRHALDKFRAYYICNAELRHIVEKGKTRFTDKMPLNETHLGLIHLVFPSAPIVHLIRHPLDVVLSAYFNDLTHGGNCAYDLVTAARHYALVFDLVQHYREQLDLNYLALRYEDMVDDPEPQLRRLLEFIGEPWEARCLAFHDNQRYARTASYAQVTEKLYTRSRFRYRNYRREVEPILPILRPAIEQLGYDID